MFKIAYLDSGRAIFTLENNSYSICPFCKDSCSCLITIGNCNLESIIV